MADSPGSPLSSLASDDFPDTLKLEDREPSVDALPDHVSDIVMMPPSKRLKTKNAGGAGASAPSWDVRTSSPPNGAREDDTDISSDTSGDVPGSPATLAAMPDEDAMSEQVTACRWDGCPVGDLGNMDALVHHIHDDHIGSRQKKYACEWDDCVRKGMPHASGYALRAHMRSHTREKPFYCALPECDRSFTRSDALAKHMRTVHETEALRPSDNIPKGHSNPPTLPRLKLILSAKPPDDRRARKREDAASDTEDDDGHSHHHDRSDSPLMTATPELDALAAAAAKMQEQQEQQRQMQEPYPTDLGLTEEEAAMPSQQLFRLLRRQVHWAEEESREHEAEIAELERRRKEEWVLKELLLENAMETELVRYDHHHHAALHAAASLSKDAEEGADPEAGSMAMLFNMIDSERKPTLLPKSLPRTFANGDEWVQPPFKERDDAEDDDEDDAGPDADGVDDGGGQDDDDDDDHDRHGHLGHVEDDADAVERDVAPKEEEDEDDEAGDALHTDGRPDHDARHHRHENRSLQSRRVKDEDRAPRWISK